MRRSRAGAVGRRAVGGATPHRSYPGQRRALNRGRRETSPTLLIDGTVAGVWHQKRSGRKIQVTVEPLGDLTARHRRELDEQVDRIGEIMEGKPDLTVGPITVGPHA